MADTALKTIDPLSPDIQLSDYVNKLNPEAKQRYVIKLMYDYGQNILPDPYSLKNGWKDDPSLWPEFDYIDIWEYLIESPGSFTRESLKAYKSLEAYRFVISGHVQVVEYHNIGDNVPFCALRAKVIPSQRVSEKPHQPWVYLDKQSSAVFCAHCTCVAGLGEVCSHVAALLFKMDTAVRLGLTSKSSTSDACKWNRAFRRELQPMTATELQPLMNGSRSKPVPSVIPSGRDQLPDISTLQSLQKVCPEAVFFTTIPKLDPEETETASEGGEFQECMQSLRGLNREHGTLPVDNESLRRIWSHYKCSKEQVDMLEKETRGQSVCPLWFEHRKGRITGTKAHDVFVMKESSNTDNLVRLITGSKCYNLSGKAAVKWGNTNEEKARHEYAQQQKGNHQYLNVMTAGLLVHQQKPFIAVSVDGVVKCACCPNRLLEIKCPYKHREKKIQDIKDKDFCLNEEGELKRSHRYYTQIQLQMYVHDVQSCDLFVYTSVDSVVATVSRDDDFCQKLVSKCEDFFFKFVLPELVSRRLEKTPSSACEVSSQSIKTCDNEVALWCLCQEPEYGRMIKCENEDCPTQWFHYECVNIRRRPRGKWVCPECSDIKD
ncbi:uncharacterized protein LOC127881093 [Dreissena polymorpha]|uniref:SWIM-type domain-containing protein n=1 Tax=Dreissena polymorpha TaxID=45954 RepID=A0A9D4GVN5_DREPO|nr:uncharacterized protein LOC127881093 [Dreissena polymorpha]KAH3822281.1 hypothetical protein DPMN_124055 [Dreissena polymorpha]